MNRRLAYIVELLRDAHWLTSHRARAYGRMVAVLVVVQAVNLTTRILASALADPFHRARPTDFDAFWAASRLSLRGHAVLAYDVPALRAAEIIGAQPAPGQFFPYLNPPILLLLCLPLALLPYLPAMLAFAAGLYVSAITLLRRILPQSWPSLTVLAFPVAMLNATEGQNGALTAACYAVAMLALRSRPALAGMSLGVLAYKPHLALCAPVALLAARRWTALSACAATALTLALLSWAVLGGAAWRGFLHDLPMMRALLNGEDTWPRMLSLYAALRILHTGPTLAAAAQATVTLATVIALIRLAARRPGAEAEMAAAVCATVLCTPYLLDYDLVCLGVPMAWLAARGSVAGWLPWEKTALAALYVYPLEARNLNVGLSLPLGPVLLGALAALVGRRAQQSKEGGLGEECLPPQTPRHSFAATM